VLISYIGVAAVFALNAASFGLLIAALLLWQPSTQISDSSPERFGPALRAGSRYIRHSLIMRRMLLRSFFFIAPAAVLWALLPVVASSRLGLSASGYGILLAALGIGAIAGAFILPRLRAQMSVNSIVVLASTVYAAVLVVIAEVANVPVMTAVLLVAGVAWLAVLASFNASIQLFLPAWVRARGLSTYQVVFLGGQGIAALGWGLIAQRFGLTAAFLTAAVLMFAGMITAKWWPLHDVERFDRSPAVYWPEPHLSFEPDPAAGPVLVTVTYRVSTEKQPQFIEAMQALRRLRGRTGATRWGLYQDGADPQRLVECYLLLSWEEHLRQHFQRLTATDQAIQERATSLAASPPHVEHLFRVHPD
jgi:hypothetical protein